MSTSECLLLNANWAFFQLYHAKNIQWDDDDALFAIDQYDCCILIVLAILKTIRGVWWTKHLHKKCLVESIKYSIVNERILPFKLWHQNDGQVLVLIIKP